MTDESRLKIVIPKYMGTTRVHLAIAGWKPLFDQGLPTDEHLMGNELDKGMIESKGDEVIKIRTRDIPRAVSWRYADVGFVGSDCLEARFDKQLVILSRFNYGREWDSRPSRVEIVAHSDSEVSAIDEIKPGSIFLAEHQHLRLINNFLQDCGYKVRREGYNAGPEFHKRLIEEGSVGVSQVGGAIPVLLDPELHFGVMVNETGRTVRDYGLKVVTKVCDIETLLIANKRSLEDEASRERILELQESLEAAYIRVQRESEGLSSPERVV